MWFSLRHLNEGVLIQARSKVPVKQRNIGNTTETKNLHSWLWSRHLTFDSWVGPRCHWLRWLCSAVAHREHLRCQRHPIPPAARCHSRRTQVSQRPHICWPHGDIPETLGKLNGARYLHLSNQIKPYKGSFDTYFHKRTPRECLCVCVLHTNRFLSAIRKGFKIFFTSCLKRRLNIKDQ